MNSRVRAWKHWMLMWLCALSLFGCRSLDVASQPLPTNGAGFVPRELNKVTLPEYVIEPPDILTINALNLIPKSPYRLRVFDTVTVTIDNLPAPDTLAEEESLSGDFVLQPDGKIQLGLGYGAVAIVGLTVEEAENKILEQLKAEVRDPQVWISLARIAAEQEIAGEHLVAPDGRVNLGAYGRVSVVGMTIEQATDAIEKHLGEHLEDPEVSVDIFGYNSKVYYVITQGAGLGDGVNIMPVRGNETALDAIGQIEGLTQVSSTTIWIARPNQDGESQILPIDWAGITQHGDVRTNYQVLPGDRIFVAEDKLIATDNMLAKMIAPIERMLGVTLLSTNSLQRLIFFEQSARFGGGF